MKKLLLAAASFLAVNAASAQITVSPEVGFQMAKAVAKSDTSTGLSTDFKPAYRAGVNLGFGVSKNISIDAGVFYSNKGYKQDQFGVAIKTNINYIEIPVYVNYNLYTKDSGGHFFGGVGPYLGYAVSAKYKIKGSFLGIPVNESDDLPIGSDAGTDAIKSLDFGVNANIGYVTKMGLYARVHYSLGLANTLPGGNSDNSIKNMSFGIALGYQIKL